MELFRTDDSHALADSARISAQLDTAYAAGAVKVIGYDLAVLGNAGLDSLEKWNLESSVEPTTAIVVPRETHSETVPLLKGDARVFDMQGRYLGTDEKKISPAVRTVKKR